MKKPTRIKKRKPKIVSGVTLEHRAGWYVHPDLCGQQRRMM